MTADREDLIRQRAYELWDQDGRPAGMDQEYWYRAERELAQAGAEDPPADDPPAEGVGGPGMTTPEPLEGADAEPVASVSPIKTRRRART